MNPFNHPITDVIPKRFSCRTYARKPIDDARQESLHAYMASLPAGPFKQPARFILTSASAHDWSGLRGLGTYGFIHGASGYIIGATRSTGYALENFGYLMESIVLFATDIGLGTCWLGGSFTRSSFNRKIKLAGQEEIPAVVAIGIIDDQERARNGVIRRFVHASERRSWSRMFWDREFNKPLTEAEAASYATPLEMVRLAPSASNRQPWQVVKKGGCYHFFLRRTKDYQEGLLKRALRQLDLQRVDMGIAMCHFELAARELDLRGKWMVKDPAIVKPAETADLISYTASWSVM